MKSVFRFFFAILAACLALSAALSASASAAPALTLEGSQAQVMTGVPYTLRCRAPGADAMALYKTDAKGTAVLEQWDGVPDATVLDSCDDAGTVTYRLRAFFGDSWVESAPLQMTVTAPYGEMPQPRIVTASPYKRGQDAAFSIATVKGAVVYSLIVKDDSGREIMQTDGLRDVYTIPADRLTNGLYHISCFVRCDGYSGIRTAQADFTVGATGKTLSLKADKETYLTNETFSLSCQAPAGAEEIILYRQGSPWKTWKNQLNEAVKDVCPDETALWYRLSARYGDEWVDTPEIRLLITAPNGGMPDPVINTEPVYPEGKDVSFTVDLPDGVTEFELMIRNAQSQPVYSVQAPQPVYTVPAGRLAHGYYDVTVYARAKGYLFDGLSAASFHVGDIDKTVMLEADHLPVLTWEEFGVKCFSPEANEGFLYEVTEDSASLFEIRHWQGAVNETVPYQALSVETIKLFLLRARFGEEWKETALIVKIAAPYGKAPAPVLRVQAQYGLTQEVIIPIETELTPALCYVNILDQAGQWVRGTEGYDAALKLYRIPAGELPPGRYQAEVTVFVPGYASAGVGTAEFLVGENSKAMILEADPAQPVTGDSYSIRFGAPYADEMILYRRDGSKEEYVYFSWKPGTVHTLTAQAWGDPVSVYRLTARFGGEWVEAPLLTVRSAAPKGPMPAPVILAESRYFQGQDAAFRVTTVDEPVTLRVSVINAGEEVVFESDYIYQNDFSISSGTLSPGSYTILAEAEGKGYAGTGRAKAAFQVMEGSDSRQYKLAQVHYDGSVIRGKLLPLNSGEISGDERVRITFYISGNSYMATMAETEADGSFEVEAVGPIEYITLLALRQEAAGSPPPLDAMELFIMQ